MRPFIRPRPVDDPTVRLILLHHAGSSAMAYYPLVGLLPDDWDVLLLDLPGRGSRHGERLSREMTRVVDAVLADVSPQADGRYALFGHSMGAIVAGEVARRLAGQGRPPVWVGVSGRSAPATPVAGPAELTGLDDTSLLTTLVGLGGLPARIGEIPEFREQFLRIVRADLEAVASYRPVAGRLPLPCPVTVFGGIDDPFAPLSSLPAWQEETVEPLRQCLFPGGHFYFAGDAMAEFARQLRAELRVELATEAARAGR
ncbi:thioesterase II family protein [Micromonospora sp. LH3U1]|uniref:thioesterase II family protein n=1 Tax=Micromonospora sp. LH3U1 TaxID=3018339 RepID=UPI00234A6DE0|nr:alpha/beta fold hydrolase [Micromonospora sp. LH3U1]WCN83977.1 alpha/beta fold hydrolase [Micromonospora sp. LH3U1]